MGGEVVKVLERMRVSGVWSRDHGKRKVLGGGGLKMDKLGRWMKRQRQAYDDYGGRFSKDFNFFTKS